MNHIHQIIWNKTLGVWTVASELAKRGKKRSSIRRDALILPLLLQASAGFALPTGNELVAGSVNVTTPSAAQMQIDQSSQQAIINWQGFSIAGHESVNIQQPNVNAALLNRVVGQDASSIQGRLNANGQVYLTNPNGVIFSKTAQVDVGGLIASTHAISNQDFLNNKLHFTQDNATGSVINHGQIKTPDGGIVALIGEQVENTGSISTPKGTTALAAGKTVDLDMQGDGLVEVKITEAAINAQINNAGIIQADGGQVIMTAQAAGQLLNTVINNQGIVQARGLMEKDGKIVLSGGDSGVVQVSGTLDTSGRAVVNNVAHPESSRTQGGNITVSGEQIHINDGATLIASGDAGGGTIVIGDKQSTSQTTIEQNASIAAQALDHGKAGTIEVLANMDNGAVTIAGQLDASAPKQGDGGFIDTSAAQVQVADTAQITTTATNGQTGTWLIDPTDFTIAASGGNITGAALGANLNSTSVTVASTAGTTGSNGDVNVNDAVSWSARQLTLNAQRNININANLNGSGTAQLALLYGQASAGGGANDNYFINGAKVTLPTGTNFSTQKGTNAGNLKNYTVITSLGALQGMSTSGINYALGADIDASSTNTGAGFSPVGNDAAPFGAIFDGLGHIITGLTINRPFLSFVGLFGSTDDSTISNVGLVGGSIRGNSFVGGLVGSATGGANNISNVYTTGSVIGTGFTGPNGPAGGLVGQNSGTISNAYATGSVTGITNVGGLVGQNSGTISNAYATGRVIGTGFTGASGPAGPAGGLVGQNSGTISNAYATGSVTGATGATGATGPIGGLVGDNSNGDGSDGTINNSFWDTQSSGQGANGVGAGDSTGATGITSADMKQLATFTKAGWDISSTGGSTKVWRIYEGFTAPLLRSFLAPLTVTANPDSKIYDGLSYTGGNGVIFTGLVTDGSRSGLLGTLSFSGTSQGAINRGAYIITPAGLFSDQQGYDISLANGALTIDPRTLTAAIIGNPTKIYDNTTAATLAPANYNLTGFVGGQGASVTQTAGAYNSPDVLTANTVTAALAAADFTANNGTLLSNYSLPVSASGAGHINPAALLAAITGNPTKTYNGTTVATLAPANYTLTGFIGTQGASVTQTAGTYNSANVATANTVTAALAASDFTANGGTLLSNYSLPITALGPGTITPALLTITANADRKIFDGIAYTGGNGVIFTGLVNNETSSVLSGSLNYGGNSQGAISPGAYDITPGGLSAGNYTIAYINGQLTIINNPINDPPVIDTYVPLVTPVTYKPPLSPTPYEPPSISVSSDLSVKDSTEEFAGITPQYCSDLTVANPMVNCQKRQKNENAVIVPTLKIKNSAGQVKRLQMSANKQFLSLLLEDGSVRIWDFQRGEQHQIVTQNKNQILTDISAVDDKGDLLSISSKAGIGAQDIIIPTFEDKLAVNEPDIRQFMTSNDGSLLLVSAGANQLSLWDSKQNKKLWQLPYERGTVNGLALADNKRYGAVLSRQPGSYVLQPADLQLKSLTDAVDIVDLDTGKVIKSLPNVGEQIISMQFKDNDTLQVKLGSGELLDWSIATGSQKTAANFAETVTAVDADTKNYAYVLNDGKVRVGDGQGHVLLSIQNKKNPFKDAMLIEGDKKLLTVMANGELSLWDVASGKKMLRLFSTQQGWTVMDAFGRFDGSEDAMDNFSWTANEEDIPLDSFSENYYEPGLLSNVLQNQDYLNINPDMVKNGITLPPKVVLQIAEQQAKADSLALQLDVYDRGGGIDKIHVYQNGKILSNENVVAAQQSLQENDAEHRVLTLNITPSAGKNTLKVIAGNDMGIENSSTELSFDGKTKAYASSLRLLTIGIDQYSDDRLNLDYSVADADLIGQAIKNSSKIAASKNLYNENATKPKILAELKELSQGVQQDVLVIYFAGHGLALGKEWYFLPYETKMQPTLEKIAATGITATELSDIFKNSKIQHILLMVDSCYSGAGVDAFSKLQNGQRYFTRKLSRSLGITVMTAAAKDQKAFELKSLGHGLFTYLVSQELQETDATQPATAHGIAENIAKTLPVFSKKMLGSSQEPAVYAKGNDFILTDVLKESNKGNNNNASDSNTPAIAPKKPAQ